MFSFQAPELCSTATSPIKNYQEEQTQTLTPPGKGPIASVRSPNCGRQQASVRGARLNPSSSGASGMKNRVIRFTVILPQNSGISLVPTLSFFFKVGATSHALSWGQMSAVTQREVCLQFPPHCLPTALDTTECFPPTRKLSCSDSSSTLSV